MNNKGAINSLNVQRKNFFIVKFDNTPVSKGDRFDFGSLVKMFSNVSKPFLSKYLDQTLIEFEVEKLFSLKIMQAANDAKLSPEKMKILFCLFQKLSSEGKSEERLDVDEAKEEVKIEKEEEKKINQ